MMKQIHCLFRGNEYGNSKIYEKSGQIVDLKTQKYETNNRAIIKKKWLK